MSKKNWPTNIKYGLCLKKIQWQTKENQEKCFQTNWALTSTSTESQDNDYINMKGLNIKPCIIPADTKTV